MEDVIRNLISLEYSNELYIDALNSISNFKLGLIRSLTKADLETIGRCGFRYKTRTMAGRREEIRNYILDHPSLRADSVEGIRNNFKILGKMIREKKEIGRASCRERVCLSV